MFRFLKKKKIGDIPDIDPEAIAERLPREIDEEHRQMSLKDESEEFQD